MTEPRHDRIFPLRNLNAYPATDWLDTTFWLPHSEDRHRRLWMMAPASSPQISVDDAVFVPRQVHSTDGAPRWVDYGVVEVPTGFTQLRIRGLTASEASRSYLVVSSQLEMEAAGKTLDEAERQLWGLTRADAGRTTISPWQGTVGEPAELTVRYSAGSRGLAAGALVRFAVPLAFDMPQSVHPDRPGFVAIKNAETEVTIDHIARPVESHVMVDVCCRLKGRLEPLQGFELCYRTEKTYIFPHLFRDTDRRYWYSKLPPLAAAVAVAEGRPFVSLSENNGHSFEFVPGPAERLHLFLPGRRSVAEKLVLCGVFGDRYRNVPPQEMIDADVELFLASTNVRIPLGTPAGRFAARHRFEIPLPVLAPDVYRAVACQQGDDRVIAQSNPMQILAQDDPSPRVYWGEIHAHTEMSDGLGGFSELYRHARQEGNLDFAASGDHACYFSDNEWLWMQDVTNAWNEPGSFVTLIGYEWAGKQVHRNMYTQRNRLELFRGMYEPTSQLRTVWRHFHKDDEVVGGPHGGLAHGLIWDSHDPHVERFVEIYSMWGANDSRGNPLVPGFARSNPRGMTANELLQGGAKLGFTGGGDCHEGHAGFSSEDPAGQGTTPHTFAARLLYRCGMTAALMPELGRTSLIDAIRNRRTYATTGARILLDFSAGGVPMEGEGTAHRVTCRATVHAVGPIQSIEIVKDGEVAWSKEYNARDAVIEWHDPIHSVQEHYYYLHATQQDGQQAWSSPVWIAPQ